MDMSKLLDEIKRAIERSGQTRYAIAKGSGVSQAQLSRFVNGQQGLSIEVIEALADYLELEIILKPKTKRKAR